MRCNAMRCDAKGGGEAGVVCFRECIIGGSPGCMYGVGIPERSEIEKKRKERQIGLKWKREKERLWKSHFGHYSRTSTNWNAVVICAIGVTPLVSGIGWSFSRVITWGSCPNNVSVVPWALYSRLQSTNLWIVEEEYLWVGFMYFIVWVAKGKCITTFIFHSIPLDRSIGDGSLTTIRANHRHSCYYGDV